ncbi:DinB family protein [Actinocorallia longicatena]|uniref:DinB family protein n=1 Tax=Actinocorallia longicatena TaxID=111803 RepID=A0ABP6QDS9_9ACTN
MDKRIDPPLTGDERAVLTGFLDWQRDTLALKCAGLTAEQLREKAVPPSNLSLLGLVRHLAEVERGWFHNVIGGENAPQRWHTDVWDDQFEVETADVEAAFEAWNADCAHSREIVTAAPSLDVTGTKERTGETFSLRWILTHMIEEYARHNGHADLLRELLDGTTGE